MKKTLFCLLLVVVSLALAGCGKKEIADEANMNKVADVSMTIDKKTLSKTSLDLTIEAPVGSVFGQWFRIDRRGKNKWEEVKYIGENPRFNELGYVVGETGKLEMTQNWEEIYGSLKRGDYRIVKEVLSDTDDKQYISAEFTIK